MTTLSSLERSFCVPPFKSGKEKGEKSCIYSCVYNDTTKMFSYSSQRKKKKKKSLSCKVYNNPSQSIYGSEIARSLYYVNSPYKGSCTRG